MSHLCEVYNSRLFIRVVVSLFGLFMYHLVSFVCWLNFFSSTDNSFPWLCLGCRLFLLGHGATYLYFILLLVSAGDIIDTWCSDSFCIDILSHLWYGISLLGLWSFFLLWFFRLFADWIILVSVHFFCISCWNRCRHLFSIHSFWCFEDVVYFCLFGILYSHFWLQSIYKFNFKIKTICTIF